MTVTAIQNGRYQIKHRNGRIELCESLAELHEVCHIFGEALRVMRGPKAGKQRSEIAAGCGKGAGKKRINFNRLEDEKIAP